MLKQRILTAIILIPLVLWGVFKLPPIWFAVSTGLVIGLAAWEWSRLMGLQKTILRILYVDVIVLLLIVAAVLPPIWVLFLGIIWWVCALFMILKIARQQLQMEEISFGISSGNSSVSRKDSNKIIKYSDTLLLKGIIGIAVLIPCWVGLDALCFSYPRPVWLLLLFALVWLADTGAYFSGRFWGVHKLAPTISPGKTWEGVYGAITVTFIVTLCAVFYLHIGLLKGLMFVILAMITVLISILGDLFESLLKRQQGLKDSGHILPGHGGILDRIDSLTAAVPFFAAGLMMLGLN